MRDLPCNGKSGNFSMNENLEDFDFIGVYIMLKKNESTLDIRLQQLLSRMERKLYNHFSIDDFLRLEELYSSNSLKFK